MKKILLSVALVAMSVFSMSALSFKVEVNGVEVKDGDIKHSDGTAYSAENTFSSIGVYDINEANLLVVRK